MKKLLPLIIGSAVLSLACVSYADQPHMQSALQSLKNAKTQLASATHDKGGHRARAQKLVDQAMDEVRAGIDYDRTHVSPSEVRK